jgi:cytoskeletal protein CcmA (bactofilin family)
LEKGIGMFRKGKSVAEDWRVQPLQRSDVTQPAAMLHPSETISSIGSEMAVIGKIICKGVLNIYGLVEGEVIASNALVADGARIQGDIVAEEATIGGRVKGNIRALRVKLQTTAVVEGDIFHRSLSIDEHAWFEGRSAPEDNPPEPRSSVKVEGSTPQAQPLVAFDDQGEFKADFIVEEPSQLRHTGMHAFLAACIAIIAIGGMSHFALSALQQPTGLAYTIHNVRINPGWIERSAQLGWTEPRAGLESTAIRASMPETPQAEPVVQNAPETIAPKAGDASLDPERAAEMPQSPAALRPTVEQPAAGGAQVAREDAKLQATDVEILAKIPLPRPRPTTAPVHKSMLVLPRSARAPITPP